MTDVVVDTSRHSDEFTSAMDASTTTNANPILIRPSLVRGRSAVSTTSEDMPETVPNQPLPPTGLLYVATMRNEDIEDTWHAHAKTMMDEINPSDSVKTFLLFRRLFKEIRRRLSIFVNETFHCLCMDEVFRPTVGQFLKLLQVIMEKLDCTLVFVDENILNSNQILLKHRLILTEMHEHYLNYMSKKKLAIECLDTIKSTMKLQSLGERSFDTGVATDQRVQMCKLLYSLFFQVITLAESYSKLVSNLISTVRDANLTIRNLSAEFTMSFNNLNDFLNDVRLGKEDQPMIETNNLPNRDTAVVYIVQCLQSNTYGNAVKYLRSARSLWPNSFGDEQNEVDVLLTIFYESLRRNLMTTNLLVILQQHFSIADLCHRLYEFDLRILQLIPDPNEQHAHLHQTIRNL